VKRRALVFAAPRRVQVLDETCAAPASGELLVRATVSAVSAGTELLAYRGELPAALALDETLPALAGASFAYPFRYGYASVGEVIATGEGVDASWSGRRVFAFAPHASVFVARAADLFVLPAGLGDERAALFASMETAVNLVLDGGPRLGERVLVVGQGVVGLLVTALLARFPLARLAAVEGIKRRAQLAAALGAHVVLAPGEDARAALGGDGADLAYELSGNPAALDAAIAATGREGRVVVGSFYGQKRHTVDLGGHFHRGRLTVQSSQVSHIAPALGGRWDRARRRDEAFRALAAIDTRPLVTHRVPFARAAEAYQLLDAGAGEALQVLLVHDQNRGA
jgi:2-desacetyl-2-hydroxyethyl bacteriochlorophyllide A dehydrogenase